MFNGKMKALTFSFDDGVWQDKRMIALLDKYKLKCTFNLNSGLMGNKHFIERGGTTVDHSKIEAEFIKDIYKGHEVAVHTQTHPNLTTLTEEDIIKEVCGDRDALSALVGYEVYGMAYPCGGVNNNDFVAKVLKTKTPIKYSRTITSTYSFDLQDNLYRYNPTLHWQDERAMEFAKLFTSLKPSSPKLFFIWGHSYEMDIGNGWQRFEELLQKLCGKDDVFYGTNSEVLLNNR